MRHAPTIRSDRPRLGTFTFILYFHNMGRLLIFAFIFSATIFRGQTSCNSTVVASIICYPNSTTSTFCCDPISTIYLCGPNTLVHDTTPTHDTHNFYVNSNSKLIYESPVPGLGGGGDGVIWVKATGSLTVLPSSIYPFPIYAETGAVLNVPQSFSSSIVNCPTISFPTVSCVQGLKDDITNHSYLNIWPSPSSTKVNFDLSGFTDKNVDITFVNQFGQSVKTFTQFSLDRNEIPIDDLPNGSYFVIVQTPTFKQTRKLIVLR
jgi:hypothetical protein